MIRLALGLVLAAVAAAMLIRAPRPAAGGARVLGRAFLLRCLAGFGLLAAALALIRSGVS